MRTPLGFPHGELVGFLVLSSWDVVESHAKEALLELAHLLQIGGHVLIFGLVLLVGEVDEELQVPHDLEALDAELDGGPQASEESLVLGDVVGHLLTVLEAKLPRIK